MSRRQYILGIPSVNANVMRIIADAPAGTRVEIKEPKRSLPQNDRFWSMLTDFADQVEHHGRRYTPDQWKAIFLHAYGQEMTFVPSLDGKGFIPIGNRSSDLSVREMCDLQEMITAEGAARGVRFQVYSREAA